MFHSLVIYEHNVNVNNMAAVSSNVKKLDHEVSICSLIPPAMVISDNMVSMF